jgi:hypothetical protein
MLHNIVQQLLLEAESLNAYGIFSLVIFFVFFTVVLVRAFALKKSHLDKMGGLPLDGGERPIPAPGKIHSESL